MAANMITQADIDVGLKRYDQARSAWLRSYTSFNEAQRKAGIAAKAFADALGDQIDAAVKLKAVHAELTAAGDEWRELHERIRKDGADQFALPAKPSRLDAVLRRSKVA